MLLDRDHAAVVRVRTVSRPRAFPINAIDITFPTSVFAKSEFPQNGS
jgi:hypothetical protein